MDLVTTIENKRTLWKFNKKNTAQIVTVSFDLSDHRNIYGTKDNGMLITSIFHSENLF